MPETTSRTIAELASQIQNDTFNLTRDDQEAIQFRIEQLKIFIQERYDQHKCNV